MMREVVVVGGGRGRKLGGKVHHPVVSGEDDVLEWPRLLPDGEGRGHVGGVCPAHSPSAADVAT